MANRKLSVLICLVLVVVATLTFSFAACTKPAGEGGNNPNNKDTGEALNLGTNLAECYQARQPLFDELLTANGLSDYAIKVIDQNNVTELDSIIDSKFPAREDLSNKEEAARVNKIATMKKNVKNLFVKRNLQVYLLTAGDKKIVDKGMMYAPVNVYESFCELMLALENADYLANYDANIKTMQTKYSKDAVIFGNFVFCASESNILSSTYDAYKILDVLETRGEYEYFKGSNILMRYNGESDVLTIPDGVEEIGAGAFEGMSNIKEVVIPASVKKIGSNAFNRIPELVYYFKDSNQDSWRLQNMMANNELCYFKTVDDEGNVSLSSFFNMESIPYEDRPERTIMSAITEKYQDYTILEGNQYVPRRNILTKAFTDAGMPDAKVSFAHARNTYYIDQYINSQAVTKGWSDVEKDNVKKNVHQLLDEKLVCMVVVNEGKAVDVITNVLSVGYGYRYNGEKYDANDRKRAFALKYALEDPAFDMNGEAFGAAYDSAKENVLRLSDNNAYYSPVDGLFEFEPSIQFATYTYFGFEEKQFSILDDNDESMSYCYRRGGEETQDVSFSNNAIVATGAFVNATKLSQITLGDFYNKEESTYVLNPSMFAGTRDIVIISRAKKESVTLKDGWYNNGNYNVIVVWGADSHNIEGKEILFDSIEMYNKDGLVTVNDDTTAYDLAMSKKDLAENGIDAMYSARITRARTPEGLSALMTEEIYDGNGNFNNWSYYNVVKKYAIAYAFDLTMIDIVENDYNYVTYKAYYSPLGNKTAFKYYYMISGYAESEDEAYNNNVNSEYAEVSGNYYIYHANNYPMKNALHILCGIAE